MIILSILCFFFFKQKTAYEMRISDWSSDVCSSDLPELFPDMGRQRIGVLAGLLGSGRDGQRQRQGQGSQGGTVWLGNHGSRSEARRVGKGCVSKCRSRWVPDHLKIIKLYINVLDSRL